MKTEWKTPQINFVLKQYAKGLSRREIARSFNDKFGFERSQDSIKHCIEVYGIDIERKLPKVLVLDIETAPMLGYVWGLWDQNISLNMLAKEWYILSWSGKWLGAPASEVIYKDQRGKKGSKLENDKSILTPLRELMDEADIILWHNGDSFDRKKINARFFENNIELPSQYETIDTLKLARKLYAFTSNKLEYLTKKFCTKYIKQDHSDFSGFKLWDECMKGNLKAWKSMEKYNKFDVLALEELFVKMAKNEKSVKVTSAMRSYEADKNKKK